MEKFIHYTKIFAVFYLAGVFLIWVGYQLGELNEMEKELKRQRKRMKELNIIDENGTSSKTERKPNETETPRNRILMFKLDAEISEMNKVQEHITKLKDEIWEKMRNNNLSRVCYDGHFTASVRGKQLLVRHNAGKEVEE